MSGWAWLLVLFCLLEIALTPSMVDKPRAPITAPQAVFMVGLQLLKLYSVLAVAGVL